MAALKSRKWAIACVIVAVLVVGFVPPLLKWQRAGTLQAETLSHLRRLTLGALLYAQDWDDRLMPPVSHPWGLPAFTWARLALPYSGPASSLENPANPFQGQLPDPRQRVDSAAGFAINHRFWNTFSSGPFPNDNIEMPGQTVLLVEAGPMWQTPFSQTASTHVGSVTYTDTTDRYQDLCPYPSPHNGKTIVSAADGHAEAVVAVHYFGWQVPHDRLFGRFGGEFYNWNGGHPNGHTDSPARD